MSYLYFGRLTGKPLLLTLLMVRMITGKSLYVSWKGVAHLFNKQSGVPKTLGSSRDNLVTIYVRTSMVSSSCSSI